jgi:cobalt/nickel transport system permease protein
MHIPDGFLSVPVWAALDAAAIPAVGAAVGRMQKRLQEGQAPLLGVMGAFVFAAQMMNFPVGLGTSGHLLGGMLLAVALGPGAATVVLTAILILQALIFQDGGLLALGANIFNMAVVGVWAGWLPYRNLSAGSWRRFAVFLGAFLSVLATGACALLELRVSGVALNPAVVSVSSFLFAVTAVLEGMITVVVIEAICRLNPAWLHAPAGPPRRVTGAILAVAIGVAIVAVFAASAQPDTLESLAQTAGLAERPPILPAPLAEYEANLQTAEWMRKAVAGLAGLAMIYAACLMLGRLLIRYRSA